MKVRFYLGDDEHLLVAVCYRDDGSLLFDVQRGQNTHVSARGYARDILGGGPFPQLLSLPVERLQAYQQVGVARARALDRGLAQAEHGGLFAHLDHYLPGWQELEAPEGKGGKRRRQM